ncbi:hypothetical protein [Alicyclobacillus acidocaldarius]|uniref:Uncharacterized protein n=1 Tax=Alicyclobacillus acidocaldarius (strain Tc-4-1) TaxID=1048834 RepID=F8II23_ALIAT|nr:hypothetical protein [Alicyclobacillus acidocaldarius]AEJ44503.1 hypothetical protein TC41_2608 [Alicyclobacillus acidocaldarius subsp. acidocaldarius Tc-4-1]
MSLRRVVRGVCWTGVVGLVAASPPVAAASSSPGPELQQAIQSWRQAPYRQTQASGEASLSVAWQAAYAQSPAWIHLAQKLARDGQLALFRAEDDVWQVNGEEAESYTCTGTSGDASVLWFRGAAYEKEQGGWVSTATPLAPWDPVLGAWTSPRMVSQGGSEDEVVAVMDAASARSAFGPWVAGVIGSALFSSRGMSQADLQALLAHTTVYGHFAISRASGAPQLQSATVAAVIGVPSPVVAHALGDKAAIAVRSMTWRIVWTMKTSYLHVSQPLPQGLHPARWPSTGSGNSTGSGAGEGSATPSNNETAGGSLQNGT